MKLKTYTAPSMSEAMDIIRRELGDDAIIISTQRGSSGEGVRITAALEKTELDNEIGKVLSGTDIPDILKTVQEALEYHNTPQPLIDKLLTSVHEEKAENAVMTCAAAFDAVYNFAPLPEKSAPKAFMMIGPPGVGKTFTVAKLAARACLNRRKAAVVSADIVRAGAAEQLAAFTKIMEINLSKVRDPDVLGDIVTTNLENNDLIYIDSPGVNPFNEHEMSYLAELTEFDNIEPILVLAAGGDPIESKEIASAFAESGASRMFVTRLDMTRRFGAVLSAADSAQLMFCDVSISPQVASGLCPINPVSMAKLVISPEESEQEFYEEEAEVYL
ncbi:MAG: GTP-binding protein [Alphaproteobacteria bacterium]|nr:GTP-binding protein [Alphaproteobacteria bacterium]